MPYLRLLLAWIVMFAIPIQGFAAATMLYCGPGMAHQGQAAVAEHRHPAGTPAHEHAQAKPKAKAGPDTGALKLSDGLGAPNLMHKCGVCAACCNAVAIAQTPVSVAPEMAAYAEPGGPPTAAYSRPSLVPDKPPRA